MASLNDVLKEVLEKDFDEKDVDMVIELKRTSFIMIYF